MNDVVKEYTKEEFNTEEPYRLLLEHKDDGFAYLQLFNTLNANRIDSGQIPASAA